MAIFDLDLAQLRRRNTIKWSRFEPDVLPMFVAEMDAMPAPAVSERISELVALGDTGYPEQPEYQQAFADFAAWLWDWQLEPDRDIFLCADVMTGMRETLLANAAPGSVVAYNTPIYPPFRAICRDSGYEEAAVPLTSDGRLDFAALETVFAERRPTVFLLCSPHNPNGTVHTRDELTKLAELADKYQVVVISDEIHAPLSLHNHVPYLDVPGAETAVVVTSASKSFNLAGLKAGLLIPGPMARARVAGMPSYVAETASYFGVAAHAAALRGGRDWLVQAVLEISQNRIFFGEELQQRLPQLEYTPAQGTYFAWLDCAPLEIAHPAQQFYEVGRVRFSFGADFDPAATQFIRVNLATSPELIAEGIRRLVNSRVAD